MSHSDVCVKSVALADRHTLHAGDLEALSGWPWRIPRSGGRRRAAALK
jgi:hypothetical protein